MSTDEKYNSNIEELIEPIAKNYIAPKELLVKKEPKPKPELKRKKKMNFDVFGNLKNIAKNIKFNGFIREDGFMKEDRAFCKRVAKRRMRNKMARKSRRINQLRKG